MKQFTWNQDMHQWERIDRVQTYRGVEIKSVTYHWDGDNARNHREYRLAWPDGRTGCFGINKRGGNIKDLKKFIDFKVRYGEAL